MLLCSSFYFAERSIFLRPVGNAHIFYMTRLHIALLQYDPVFCCVEQNILHADSLIAGLQVGDIDVLLLPETAFTGYMWTDREEVEPYLETLDGPSVGWAKRTATRLRCYVLVGFPERSSDSSNAYNAMVVVNWQGQVQVRVRQSAWTLTKLCSCRLYTESISCSTRTKAGQQKAMALKVSYLRCLTQGELLLFVQQFAWI